MEHDIVSLLINLHRGKLNRRQADRVRQKIESDPKVAELNAVIGEFEQNLRAGRLRDDFDVARNLSARLFRDFVRKRTAPKRGINVYDSGLLPLPEGVRPALIDTRRLKYRFDDFAVEICLYPVTPDSYEMIGQIDGFDPGRKIKVRLTANRLTKETCADEFHLFHFDRVPETGMTLKFIDGSAVKGTIEIEP